jgi:hypothetical protein
VKENKKMFDLILSGNISIGRRIEIEEGKAKITTILSLDHTPHGLRIKGWCKPVQERIKTE